MTVFARLFLIFVFTMPNAGPNNWGTANDSGTSPAPGGSDSVSWAGLNPPTTATLGAGSTTHYLKLTNFGFSLAAGSNVLGIQAAITTALATGSGTAKDNSVKIIQAGTIGGTDHSSGANLGSTQTYGNLTSDLWGNTWLFSDINDAGFGLALSVAGVSSAGTWKVTLATLTVAYTTVDGQEELFQSRSIYLPGGPAPRSAAYGTGQSNPPQALLVGEEVMLQCRQCISQPQLIRRPAALAAMLICQPNLIPAPTGEGAPELERRVMIFNP